MGKKDQENVEEEKPENSQSEGEGKKKFPLKLIVLFIGVLVLAGGGFFLWKSGNLPFLPPSGDKAHAAKEAAKEPKVEIGPTRAMDNFIVNLADPSGKRYLKVKLDLELNSEKLLPEIEKRMPQIRDSILTLLSSKSFQDIKSPEEKLQLRAEIMVMLNQHLKTGKITNIYFSEFIVQ